MHTMRSTLYWFAGSNLFTRMLQWLMIFAFLAPAIAAVASIFRRLFYLAPLARDENPLGPHLRNQ